MAKAEVHYAQSDLYETGKHHVEYMSYFQLVLARVIIGRFTAKLLVEGDCYFRHENRIFSNLVAKPDLLPKSIEAVRSGSPDIRFTRKNYFSILVFDKQQHVETLYLGMKELPTPLATKDLLLKTLRNTILQRADEKRSSIRLKPDEKEAFLQIKNERMVNVRIKDTVPLSDLSETMELWFLEEPGLVNVMEHYQFEAIPDKYGRKWLTLEFELAENKRALLNSRLLEALSPYCWKPEPTGILSQ